MNLPARIEQTLKFSDPVNHHQIAAALGHDLACVCSALNNMLEQGRVRVAHYERRPGSPTRYYDLNVHLPSARKPKALHVRVKCKKWRENQKVVHATTDNVLPAWMR